MNRITKITIKNLIKEMYDDVKPGYSRMGTFDRPGPITPDLRTVVPELPLSAVPQTATQLSTELPNIDDEDAQPVGPDLKHFMSALADRVPDDEAAKFYRRVRRYIEKQYGIENDERVGKIEETFSMDEKLVERIVRKVGQRIALNEGRRPLRENAETKKRLMQFYKEVLNDDEREDFQFDDKEIENMLRYLYDNWTNGNYTFEEFDGYIGVMLDDVEEVAQVTPEMAADYVENLQKQEEEKVRAREEKRAAVHATAQAATTLDDQGSSVSSKDSLVQPNLGLPRYALRATSKADNPEIKVVYYIRDEDLARADDYTRKNILSAKKMLVQDIKDVIKPRVLNFLGLARTVQHGHGESATQIKEDPNYDLMFDYYFDKWEVTVRAANVPEPTYLVVTSSGEQQWTIVKVVIEGKQLQPPFDKKAIVSIFRTLNAARSTSEDEDSAKPKTTQAKAYEYQRLTGEKLGSEYRSSWKELSPVAREEFPGTYSADKDITSAVKDRAGRHLLQAFMKFLTQNNGIKAVSKAARGPAIDKIVDKLQKSFDVSKNGETIDSPIDDDVVMNLFIKHYAKRDSLHLTAHTKKFFERFNNAWKDAYKGSGIPKIIFDNRLKNSIGVVMESLLVSKLRGSDVVGQQFDVPNIDELFKTDPQAFYTQAAATQGISKDEWAKMPEAEKNSIAKDFYDKIRNLCEDALGKFVSGLSEVPEVSEKDAADWIMDALKDKAFQIDMEQAGVSIIPKTESTNENYQFFGKFMNRILESRNLANEVASDNAADYNQRVRRRAAAEKEHYLHTMRVKR